MRWIDVLQSYSALPRQRQATATDVLTGRSEPGGRLPVTLPATLVKFHLPRSQATGRPLNEYSSDRKTKYMAALANASLIASDHQNIVLDTASHSSFDLSQQGLRNQEELTANCTVHNTGKRKGSTVVQVYLRPAVAETSQPVRRLVAIRKCM